MSAVSSERPLRFAVSGYYGCGNAGDEAVLAGIQTSFRRQAGNGVILTVLSQNPDATRALHGLDAVYRMDLRTVWRTLRSCDLLLSGGGSLLQDTTSVRSLFYYLAVLRLARAVGTPTMFYAQGLGPLHHARSRRMVRRAADQAAAITVRDPSSAQLLRDIGVTNPSLEITADPAFALNPAPEDDIDRLMESAGIPQDTPLIGVALRPWGAPGTQSLYRYAALLLELERTCEAKPVLLPFHAHDDVPFADEVVRQTGHENRFVIVRSTVSPSLLLGLIGRMKAVAAMRLHALIFAARAAVPPFALAYDPKVSHLMALLDLRASLADWGDFDPIAIAEQVRGLIAERPNRVAALRARLPALEYAALRSADRALEIVAAPLPRPK